MRPPAALFEIYDDRFARESWGGIETALHFLIAHLRRAGVLVETVASAAFRDPDAVAAQVRRDGIDVVLPLVDGPLFTVQAALPVVRIWHDVSRADEVDPAAPFNVFFRDESWTRRFRERRYIPWSPAHVPARDLRDPDGPVVVQLGKIPNPDAFRLVDALLSAGRRVRLLFCAWSRTGRHALGEAERYRDCAGVAMFPHYDVERDHARIFGGAASALVLSSYVETYNFLAAEAVQLGIPVVALEGSGATRHFASACVGDAGGAIDLVCGRADRRLAARRRCGVTWTDVALRYRSLFEEVRARAA